MKKYANFSYDRRGWKQLHARALDQLQKRELDPELIEINLNGNPIKCKEDVNYLTKILGLFTDVRSIFLRKCHLHSHALDWLGELLCVNLLRCKRIDLAGNCLPAQALTPLLGILDGRSQTKSVCPFWLALGDGMAEELLTKSDCDPMSPKGCVCRSKREVHVVRFLRSKAFQNALAKLPPVPAPDTLSRRAEPSDASDESPPPPPPLCTATTPVPEGRFPPPPSVSPPPAPRPPSLQSSLAKICTDMANLVDQQRDLGHIILMGGYESMLANIGGKFCLVDVYSMTLMGKVQQLYPMEKAVSLCDLKLFPQHGDSMLAVAEAYKANCTTPDSYLATQQGDIVQFKISSFESGFVAATYPNLNEWKWFPLEKLSVVAE